MQRFVSRLFKQRQIDFFMTGEGVSMNGELKGLEKAV